MKITNRVKAGIAFLDARYGKGWRKDIDKKQLDLSDSESCPLGQTDSDYNEHQDKLELTDRVAYDLGFHIDPKPGDEYPEAWNDLSRPIKAQWDRLTDAWKRLL